MIMSRLTPDQGDDGDTLLILGPSSASDPARPWYKRDCEEREREGGGPGRATCFLGQHGCSAASESQKPPAETERDEETEGERNLRDYNLHNQQQ